MIALRVVPFGPLEPGLIEAAIPCLWEAFDVDVRIDRVRAILPEAWDAARAQYNSEILLRSLLSERAQGDDRLLGVTSVDLFIPMLSYVFGQAQLDGPAAIVSTARLDPSFYGMLPQPVLARSRFVREVLHEIGHTFGLRHCEERKCPMALAASPGAIDGKGTELCAGCAALVRERRRERGRSAADGPSVGNKHQ